MRSARWFRCAAAGAATGAGGSTGSNSGGSSGGPSDGSGSKPNGNGSTEAATGAAGTAPQAPTPPSVSGGARANGKGANEAAATAFRPLRLHQWQVLGIQLSSPITRGAAGASSLFGKSAVAERLARLPPTALLYHGSKLGPRPLIILDHSLPPPPPGGVQGGAAGQAEAREGDARAAAVAALHAIQPSDSATKAARKYEAILSHLNWAHGAVYIPIHVDVPSSGGNTTASAARDGKGFFSEAEESLLEVSCRQVAAVLDALDVTWAHFLTYSYGTLVAARMAASRGFPHRVGSFIALDTPLVTRAQVQNVAAREELAAATEDVNVPLHELEFAKEALREGREGPLPCPVAELARAAPSYDVSLAKNDADLYEQYLFHPEHIFEQGGLRCNESRYTPVRALAEVQHPLQLVVPAASPLTDVFTHKEFFGLRRPAVIKAARSHAGLFGYAVAEGSTNSTEAKATAGEHGKAGDGKKKKESGGTRSGADKGRGNAAEASKDVPNVADSPADAAKEVADVIGAWLNRFEQDVVIKRRYEQAAKEMAQLMGSGGAGEGEAAGAAGSSSDDAKRKGKKKEKKKKG